MKCKCFTCILCDDGANFYKGNWYSDNGDILLEIFDTNNFYDSEIMEDITIKLNYESEKIHALITLNDEHINLIYDDYLNLI